MGFRAVEHVLRVRSELEQRHVPATTAQPEQEPRGVDVAEEVRREAAENREDAGALVQ